MPRRRPPRGNQRRLPYAPYDESVAAAVRKTVVTHIVFFGIVLAVLLFFGRRVVEMERNLREAHGEIRTLRGIPVDACIMDRPDAMFSHGICPGCLKKRYGD